MDKLQKAMALIQQGMDMLQEVLVSRKMVEVEGEEMPEDMEGDIDKVLPMDASDKTDKKALVISLMKKKGF